MKKNNDILKKEVKEALKWEPVLHSTEIDVHVNEGAVDLGGTVDTYAQKKEAEHVVKKIAGVRDVVNNVKVDLFTSDIRSDKEITDLVTKTLKDNWAVPNHRLTITVKDGWVTLKGILHWNFQRKAAEEAIRYLNGVRGVIDEIKIEAEIKNEIEKEIVEKALRHSWLLDVDNIKVRVDGKTILLSGIVDSLFEKEEAERIAWNTPGVCFVDNELLVEFN